jgi:hypothetical protein
MFARKEVLNLDGFQGAGADWLERFKPYIEDGKTIVVSPHRVWGPETNDLVLQLRKRQISKIILGGMLASNLTCANCSSKVSRSPWSRTPRRAPSIPNGAMAMRLPSLTTRFSLTPS